MIGMTREEAIKLLKQYQGYEPMFPDGEKLKHAFDLTDETVDTLLAALRGPTREMVERMRGEWLNFYNDFSTAECSKCGELFDVSDTEENLKVLFEAFQKYYRFCPACGSPMTDEAVQMVMERMRNIWTSE